MINLLLFDKDPLYGRCIETTSQRMKDTGVQYLGQIFTLKELEITSERESIDILLISSECYTHPHHISQYCRILIITSIDLRYTLPITDTASPILLMKPFIADEFVAVVSQAAKSVRNSQLTASEESIYRIESAIQYIQNHLADELNLESLSDLIHYSPSYFSKCFKEHTGKNVSDYIRELRIQRAEVLLATTDYQIQEIADMVGIFKINTFGTVFRKAHGISPTAYRNRHKTSVSEEF